MNHTLRNQLWVLLGLTWWMGSFLAWVTVANAQQESTVDSARLVSTALFAILISAVLRLPAITETSGTSSIHDHLVWSMSIAANVNWLGMLVLLANSISLLSSMLLLGLTVELWLGVVACHHGRLHWFRNGIAFWLQEETVLTKSAIVQEDASDQGGTADQGGRGSG
jgi:hypothetical protein